jgi:hypothetical protein
MRAAIALLGTLGIVGVAGAQENLVRSPALISGVQARGYSIEDGPKTSQFAFPFAFAMPVNDRLSFDVGTYFASTEADDNSISGFTDTQVRGSYVFGRDAVVATLMVNLPTGKRQTQAESFTTGAASTNFLSFPVNAYRTGTSVTGGLAAATELGSWNVGMAGSFRVSGEYEPFSDDSVTYSPGAEARVKLGLDRLLGNSRLAVGFTFSTFGNDDFGRLAGGASTEYQPGSRFIGELSLSFLALSGNITAFIWDYYRNKAGNTGAANKENILSLGATGSWQVGTRMRLEPLLEARFWSPEDGGGTLFGGGAALQMPLGERFSLSPSARFDFGTTEFRDGTDHSITGWGASVLVRYDL